MPGDIAFDDGLSFFGANLTIAVLNGTVPQWRLDDMATRILAAWYYVGRDNNTVDINFSSWTEDTFSYEHYFSGKGYGLVNEHVDTRGEHGALIRDIGARSTVLLKNVRNTLPLSGKEKLTTVFGEDAGDNPLGPNGCADRGCDSGTLGMAWGSGSANFPYLVTPESAIQQEIVSHYGAFESITDNSALAEIGPLANRVANAGGVCIAFANADSGEGFIQVDGNYGDRNNLTFWQGAEAMLANVTANCNNTVLVIHSTGPVEIGQYKNNPNITAILWAGVPGEQSGNSIADVLYGRVNPGAKLPFTLADTREDYGTDILYTPNQPVPQTNFEEGIFIDYRAFDRKNITPVYEFGFGLSYTNFSMSNLQITKINAGNYSSTTGYTAPAPKYGNITNNTAAHVFPANFTRVPLYVYPWLNSTNLTESYGWTDYGDNSFVPEGALDGSPQKRLPASGAPGGNPELWDVLYRVTCQVTNIGKVAGEEVPQLYLSLGGPYDAQKILRGFERLSIQPNQTTTASFDIMRRDLSNWDTVSQNWVISNYTKTVYVGNSSRNLHLSGVLH